PRFRTPPLQSEVGRIGDGSSLLDRKCSCSPISRLPSPLHPRQFTGNLRIVNSKINTYISIIQECICVLNWIWMSSMRRFDEYESKFFYNNLRAYLQRENAHVS